MFKKLIFKSLPSTNLYVKEHYQVLKNKTLVVAERQTEGRGRLGRTWLSDDDITMSILLKENLKTENIAKMSLVCASALAETLRKYGDVKIKWPNDILLNGKKLVGILAESVIKTECECLIIGIGINCNEEFFSGELKDKATSLKIETGTTISKNDIVDEFLANFEKLSNDDNGNNEWLQISRKYSSLIGQTIKASIKGKDEIVLVKNIQDNGNLLVEKENELIELTSGEVTLTKNY